MGEFSFGAVCFAVVQIVVWCGVVLVAFLVGRRSMLNEIWATSEWVNDPHTLPDPPTGSMDVVGGGVICGGPPE